MRILLVSPPHRESDWLSKALRESAHSLRRSNDLHDGILTASRESFDAIVLMILEPSSYPELTSSLRQFEASANGAVIVVVLGTATSGDRTAMLRAGADACFTQPYSYLEMHERMQVLHRTATVRHQRAQREPQESQPAQLQLDPLKRELVDGHRRLPLTKREYLVLECLMRQFDVPVRHDELLRYAWPEKEDIDLSTASPLVWRLRRKLKQHLPDVNISTVSCYGYQLTRTPVCVRAPVHDRYAQLASHA